jgi:hypothetical protein
VLQCARPAGPPAIAYKPACEAPVGSCVQVPPGHRRRATQVRAGVLQPFAAVGCSWHPVVLVCATGGGLLCWQGSLGVASHNAPRRLWGSRHWSAAHRLALLAVGGEPPRGASAVWRMEQGGPWPPVFGRAQEPPLSSRWPLLIGTGYNCRRPIGSFTEGLPVLGQLGSAGALFCCLQCLLLLFFLVEGAYALYITFFTAGFRTSRALIQAMY